MENLNLQLCLLSFLLLYFPLLAELSFLVHLVLAKKKLVHGVDVVFIFCPLYPMLVTCISEVIFNAVFWNSRHSSGIPAPFSLHSFLPQYKTQGLIK